MKHVMPTLTQGLIESCKVRPDDAIDYLVSSQFNEVGIMGFFGVRKTGFDVRICS